jgi:DNA replication protein DnaC
MTTHHARPRDGQEDALGTPLTIGNPTLADAILDRLVHNAYRLELNGKSKRKEKEPNEQD